ncbi:MAG TPA: AraC family transcriptional regulator [Sphingobium sp.]|uniref:DJ-1/PfpI family protein n=1 Tax=unclassified Sphingobium TaxID=2611147 RepID=UPI0007F4E90D|nr:MULTISPECIES: DJ-1/PfpI family protein [unclassified Sphingobium]OAN53653.1 AraC family transcriptional regulator [Sphingobium sp. TCM1]WIW87261.1 DJ-1/PfpI family protein [Sphingobium sp. V4]HAF40233.1 AraC family transcriptional regulator [Sphingobium sp.]
MRIAILSFDGFNELDSFVALALLNRVKGWRAEICGPGVLVTSMNGVAVHVQQPMEFTEEADIVLVGSGVRTRAVADDAALMARIRLDPARQIIGAQCSGALLLAKLGLLDAVPVCTDLTSKPWVEETGARVIDAPFHAAGNVATAGGCMAAHYLAAWAIARGAGEAAARDVIDYVAPVGEKAQTVARVMGVIGRFL